MTATSIFLGIISGVCLMLWGVRMVKLGFTRGFGASLRQAIAKGTKNRLAAFGSGFGVTMLLQSSTATALILASFADKGMITAAAAIAVMIGADVGTTVLAQIFTFDLSFLAPMLLIIGVIGHLIYEHGGKTRQAARIIIGLGFIMMSLQMIRTAAVPLKESDVLPLIIQPLNDAPAMALIFAALLTWIMHSSLAAVLLFSSMAAAGIFPMHLTLIMILGVNIGAAMTPIIATMKDSPAARRIPIGNLLMRLATSVIVLPFIGLVQDFMNIYSIPADRVAVTFHMMYNMFLAVLFLPWTETIAKLAGKIMPDNDDDENPMRPKYLDYKVLNSPTVALTGAARETLRLADIVEEMLNNTFKILETNEHNLIQRTRDMDNVLDTLYKEIKTYMTRLSREELDQKEADKYVQVLTFSTNLEHAGDIIDKSLLDMAEKKVRKQDSFSKQGFEEIREIHMMVIENLRLSQNLFLARDRGLARQLIEEKRLLRQAEKKSTAGHFRRMQSGLIETLATSSLHLDIVRDYRRINTYITSVAYSILDRDDYTDQYFDKLRRKDKKEKKKAGTPRGDYGALYDFDAGAAEVFDIGHDMIPPPAAKKKTVRKKKKAATDGTAKQDAAPESDTGA